MVGNAQAIREMQNTEDTRPSDFFNNWPYIGASKPTCRLCDRCSFYPKASTETSNLRTTSQIEALVPDEINFLEGLAFSGLCNNITDRL